MSFVKLSPSRLEFKTKSGILTVVKKGDLYETDLTDYDLVQVPVTEKMSEAIGSDPVEAWLGRDLVCVMEKEEDVINTKINPEKVKELEGLLLNVTAKESTYDCFTRGFVPKLDVLEYPVCGSGHCHVVLLWAEK